MNKLQECHSIDFCTLDYECAYLPDKKTRMLYRYIPKATKELASALIKRGWRRFGHSYFHPICQGCNECKNLRIDVKSFKPSKSQRRAIKKNANTKIYINEPSLTYEHLDLYNKYHKFKEKKSGWKYNEMDLQTYYEEFVVGAHVFGKEVLYFHDNRLVGVDLIDILDDGISAIYFYYDPDYEKLSLGIYSLIVQINLARNLGLDWIYLGYWVDGCASFAYKTKFQPYEILEGFPAIDEEPLWQSVVN
ncbi:MULTISPECIES: arginyltransferase [unclassified Nitratiruptor]|uniref:arginyltransferase n=1 Tax=unclassified Nitratiruptor TaxID=2624044 RepID=UPI001916B5B2|nr:MULTISPECIES: arginyltransferase [unclassified Nitratiruptor]BCD59427.1 leucyl-tRNA---protein transferase [Nitratiruptor sp. YY08-10]BCD63351.1 leucyl-tRNA---protein transferase [Nitratiruptor sp. YY08-14]